MSFGLLQQHLCSAASRARQLRLFTSKHISTAAALVLVDTLGCLFPVSVAGTRNAVLFLGFPGILVCGLFWDFGSRACGLFR